MASPLAPIRVRAPGSKGLNTEDATNLIDLQWATTLKNVEFDNSGRAVSRRGFAVSTTTYSGTAPGANDIKSMHAYQDSSNTVIISAANSEVYYGTSTMTNITGTATITAGDNWQFVTFESNSSGVQSGTGGPTGTNASVIVGFQQGEAPIKSTVSGGTPGDFADISATGVPTGNCAVVAFGRIWAANADKLEVKACDILDETDWNTGDFYFNTEGYWPNGVDYVQALAAWEDKLVVFGRENILIYDGCEDPTNSFALFDTISGVGCVARDSVQPVGQDILFLSDTGLQSLRRTIQNERAPLQEIGYQVRDELVPRIVGNEDNIKSVYDPVRGFYLLLIDDTTTPAVFMYDFKSARIRNELGAELFNLDNVRVSIWDWPVTAFAFGTDGELYGGFRNSSDSNNAVVGTYSTYLDNTSTYFMEYKTPWIDLNVGAPQQSGMGAFYMIPKTIVVNTIGGAGYSLIGSWAYDYAQSGSTETKKIPGTGSAAESEWNVAEWGIGEWGNSSTFQINRMVFHPNRYGQVVQFGIKVRVNGDVVGLQQLDIFLKKGRLSH